jgi:hypothetical protein
MKSSVFWDITLFSLLKVSWRFGGASRLYLQGITTQVTGVWEQGAEVNIWALGEGSNRRLERIYELHGF